jgi:hypothetical protein
MRTAIERVDSSARAGAEPHGLRPVTASMFRLPYNPGAARVLLDRLERIRVEDGPATDFASLPVPQRRAD